MFLYGKDVGFVMQFCMFVSCVHPVQALRDAFCLTCSLLMLVGDAIGDHMDEAYFRVGLMTPYRWPQASLSVYPMLYL